jgi:hypothetical protein
MHKKVLTAMMALAIIATIGFTMNPGQKITSAFADDNDKKSTGISIPPVPPYAHTPFYATFVNNAGIPAFTSSSGPCMQGTYGTGSGVLPSYTFPMGVNAYDPSLGGNPSTFTGWCVAENDVYGNSDPCYVANGIAWYGLCEPGICSWL